MKTVKKSIRVSSIVFFYFSKIGDAWTMPVIRRMFYGKTSLLEKIDSEPRLKAYNKTIASLLVVFRAQESILEQKGGMFINASIKVQTNK